MTRSKAFSSSVDSSRPYILEVFALWIKFRVLIILYLASRPGIKPTCSGPMIFVLNGLNLLARILARSFKSMLSKEIGLKLEQSVWSLSGFGITII